VIRPLHRVAVLGLVAALGITWACTSTSDSHPNSSDKAAQTRPVFPETPQVVQKLRPDRPDGMVWQSDWSDTSNDPWVVWYDTGASHVIDPNTGTLTVGGDTVRMYVRNPDKQTQWTGALEVTVYARRLAAGDGEAPPYSGIVTDVRTNHGTVHGSLEKNPCDSRGMSARLRFDGRSDFGKEISHPKTVSRHERRIWDGGMPIDVWIGYKQLIYDDDNKVVQELYVDFPGEGQNWVLVNRNVDRGGWGRDEKSCAKGINPTLQLFGGTERPGSETGLPNIAVLFRVDGLDQAGGLEYRSASVREVTDP